MVFSAVSLSFMGMLVKIASNQGVTFFEVIVFRSIIQWILTLASLLALRVNVLGPPEKRKLMVVRGAVGLVGMTCYFFSITVLPLSEAVALSFTNPVFTAILAVIMLGEVWELWDMIGAGVSSIGVVFIARPAIIFGDSATADDGSQFERFIFVCVALFGACNAAFAYVTVRKIGKGVNVLVMVNYFSLISIIGGLIGMAVTESRLDFKSEAWLPLMGIGVTAFLGQVALNRGLQLEKAARATTMNYLQIVFAFILQVTLLKQPINVWSIVGAGMITLNAVFSGVRKWRGK
eukprot:TRINITY_DN15015_c0_g1_i1.p1 TRINITY_DN15015_c0_g1~~TRINITY_DN15015_c0_g1_i1.p1  ORF type:complete len:291 (-),score=60.04 TRINITY_DN15015_c0_g1_i1:25-897(-)